MLTMELLREAQGVLDGVITRTPMMYTKGLVEDCEFYLKAECLQKTGAFKLRGAYFKLSTLTGEERSRGVIACSAGNHAQGVAYSARAMGIPATICIPAGAPISKIEATRSYGAQVVLVPGVYDDAHHEAVRLQKERGLTFIHPFDDYKVMAGQGTIGLEILEQLPELDMVLVPIGGGGLISGIAYAIKQLKPDCQVIGVQAEGAPCMLKSLENGCVTSLEQAATIADGIQVKTPGQLCFELCSKYVDKVVTVSESEISAAIVAIMEKQKLVAEGAGAVATAAAMFGKVDVKGKNVCAVLSAGNVDVTTLERIITRGLSHSGRTASFTTVVPDRPGSLVLLLTELEKAGVNVLDISHERGAVGTAVTSCFVHLRVETKNSEHIEELYDRLMSCGYEIMND